MIGDRLGLFVDDGGHIRPMGATDEAAMNSAFQQFVAERGKLGGVSHGPISIRRAA